MADPKSILTFRMVTISVGIKNYMAVCSNNYNNTSVLNSSISSVKENEICDKIHAYMYDLDLDLGVSGAYKNIWDHR